MWLFNFLWRSPLVTTVSKVPQSDFKTFSCLIFFMFLFFSFFLQQLSLIVGGANSASFNTRSLKQWSRARGASITARLADTDKETFCKQTAHLGTAGVVIVAQLEFRVTARARACGGDRGGVYARLWRRGWTEAHEDIPEFINLRLL